MAKIKVTYDDGSTAEWEVPEREAARLHCAVPGNVPVTLDEPSQSGMDDLRAALDAMSFRH